MLNCQSNYIGAVVKTTGERVMVKVEKPSACGSCKACAMFNQNQSVVIPAKNVVGARVGDMVEITPPTIKPLFSTLMLLILPLALLVAGIVVGATVKLGELFIALFALVGAVLGFTITLIIDRTVLASKYLSQTVKIIENTNIGEKQ